MSTSTHQIKVKAVDETAGAFGSIKNRAKATGAQIKSIMGGAIAAAGAYMGFSAIKDGVKELGHLSDVSMRTSTSVDELTRAAAALNVLGVDKMGVDEMAKAFDYLQKSTGRSGMSGFLETIGELGKIEDVALRSQKAVEYFGKSGMALIPLVNAANVSTEALTNVINAMPQIPQSAAEAGDAAADAMTIVGEGVHSIWLQAIGAVVGLFDNNFAGGVRTAAAEAAAWMEYYAKVSLYAWKTVPVRIKSWFDSIGGAVGAFVAAPFQGENPFKAAAAAFNYWQDFADEKTEELMKPVERFAEQYAKKRLAIEKLAVSIPKAAISTAARADAKIGDMKMSPFDSSMTLKTPEVRNDLIMGGNEANRVAMLGPQLQTESKKQTALLQEIANGVKKNTEAVEQQTKEEFSVID